MIKVIGFGSGGHARVLIEILHMEARYDLVGLLDSNPDLKGQVIAGVPVLGDDSLLSYLYEGGLRYFFVGVGSVTRPTARRHLFEMAHGMGMEAVNAIHPRAILSPSAKIGTGLAMMAGAIVNPQAIMGDNVIINTGAIVEHDCVIGDHVHVATGARLCGGVQVGSGAHIGAGAVVRQCIIIGDEAVVGAGAVVVKDVPAGATMVGIPANNIAEK